MKSAVLLSVALSATARQTPITRVVELLNGLAEKCEYDFKKQEDLYEDFVCWGKTVINAKTESNKKAESRIDHLKAYIEDLEAGRVELTSERVDLEKELATLNSDIETAEALREKEHTDFKAAEKEMKQAIGALEDAIDVLNEATKDHKDGSLLALRGTLNGGFAARAAEADALSMAVEVGQKYLTPGDAFFLQSVLGGDVGGPDWKKLNRKATFKMSYKARSGKIQSMLKKLLESFESSLEDAEKKEEDAVKEHDDLMSSKKDLREKAENALTAMTGEGGASGLSKEESEAEVEDLEEQVKNDEGFIKDTKKDLDDKKKEWKTRKELMMGEIAAINKAISILHSDDARDLFSRSFESKSASFLQVAAADALQERVSRAVSALKSVAKDAGDVRLLALSVSVSTAQRGHFDKVLTKIDDMIKQLEDEQKEDEKVKDECEENRADDIADARELSHDIDDLTDDISSLEKEIKEHKDEINENEEKIDKLNEELTEAKKQRKEEHEAWEQSDADDKAAAELVESAKEVLAKFYEDNDLNLLQRRHHDPPKVEAGEAPPPPPSTWEEPYGGASESKGIVSMLETIKEDIESDRASAKEEEDDAQTDYDEFKSDAEGQVETLEDSITDLEETVSNKEDDITDKKDETGTKKKELETTVKKLKDAQEGCDFITVNFKLRKENREIEVEGLKKAKEILEEKN